MLFLRTAWELSAEDLARANAGATLILGVQGDIHPVVHLLVDEPPGDRPAGVVSPSFVLTEDERPDSSLWLKCVARFGGRELSGEVCLRDRLDETPLPRATAAGLVVECIEQQARQLGLLPA